MSSDIPQPQRYDIRGNSHDDRPWLINFRNAAKENKAHFWNENPHQLITKSDISPGAFTIGNGADVYSSTILPALETAEHEILFVTCFWSRSQCLIQLGETLIELSQRARRRPAGTPKLRIRLCFSSRSVFQKLFHTSSTNGYIYKPSDWVSKLGLPPPEALNGLDLQVKSLFFLPFSVMHPKYVIIDRKRALLPSCNLSYESWLEGCLPLTGPIVNRLVQFWGEIWGSDDMPDLQIQDLHAEDTTSALALSHTITLLPSPHHRSPRFRPFLSPPTPPRTPLNAFLEHHIANAKSSIKILTPNLTCQAVILSLLAALSRGVDVTIITNRLMMMAEQLLTAGTLTEICVWKLKRRYRNLLDAQKQQDPANNDVEAADSTKVGKLSVGYFLPDSKYAKSHLKCTIFDDEVAVLGSGNMDRASWYTSQELGVAVQGRDIVKEVWGMVEGEFEGRDGGGARKEWVEWV